jgi:hypothetical protein
MWMQFMKNKWMFLLTLLAILLLLGAYLWKNHTIDLIEGAVPVPGSMELYNTENKQVPAGLRTLYFYRGYVDFESLKSFYRSELPRYGWKILKDDDKGITADKSDMRVRLVLHDEKQQSRVTVNLLIKKN